MLGPSQLAIDPRCPRAGHGCAREHPVSLAAGWNLVQRDWSVRQGEPGPAGTARVLDATRRLAVLLGRRLVRLAVRMAR